MRSVRVGFIGAGAIFPHHIEAVRRIAGVEVVALCDIDAAHARRHAATYGIPLVAENWRSLVGKSVDALFVLTPPSVHREPVVAALEAGVHVYCEKPLAHTLEDGRAIVRAAQRSNAVCQIGFNNLFEPPTRQMWLMAREGTLGRLARVYDRHYVFRKTASWTDPARRDRWRLDQNASGGRMQEFGSHKVNWLLAIGGRAAKLVGRSDSVAQPLAERGVDDTNVLLVDFTDGGVGTVEITMTPTTWDRRSVGIVGTEASVEWIGGETIMFRRKDGDGVEEIALAPVPETRHEHFFRWIRETGDPKRYPTPEVTAESAYDVLEVCLGFLESAKTREVLSLGKRR